MNGKNIVERKDSTKSGQSDSSAELIINEASGHLASIIWLPKKIILILLSPTRGVNESSRFEHLKLELDL